MIIEDGWKDYGLGAEIMQKFQIKNYSEKAC